MSARNHAHEPSGFRLFTIVAGLGALYWLPLLALNAFFPGVRQVVATPELRAAVLYSIALALLTLTTIAVAGTFGIQRATAHHESRIEVAVPAYAAVSVAAATMMILVAFFVLRGPRVSVAQDVIGFALALVIAGAVAAVTGFASAAFLRSGVPVIVILAIGVAGGGVWAFLLRMLIRGTPSIDAPLTPWAIAAAPALLAAGTPFGRWTRIFTATAAFLCLAGGSMPSRLEHKTVPESTRTAAASPRRANVLIVVIDTWRYDATQLAGPGGVSTPTLARLAARGTLFSKASSSASSTIPSIKGLITGRPASRFGLLGWGAFPPPRDAWTIARAFRSAGFQTGAFIANDLVHGDGFESGFEKYWVTGAFGNVERSLYLQLFLARRDYWRTQLLSEKLEVLKTRGGSIVAELSAWLKNRDADDPFFAYVHLMEPHWPYEDRGHGLVAPDVSNLSDPYSHVDVLRGRRVDSQLARRGQDPRFRQMVGRYREEIREADLLLQRVLDVLEARGVTDETLVIVTGDHGEEFFEHNKYGHGHDVFEELTHVPLLVSWPRTSEFAGMPREVVEPVSLLDIAPTLADLFDLRAARGQFAGRSLRPVLNGSPGDHSVIAEAVFGTAAVLSYRRGPLKGRFVFDPGSLPSEASSVVVFDLGSDPREAKSLTRSDPRVAPFLALARSELDSWWKAAKKSGPQDARAAGVPDEALERLRSLGYLK